MQTLVEYRGEDFIVLNCEKQHMIHPVVFGILPVWKDTSPFEFELKLKLDNYKLSLQNLWVHVDCALPVINQVSPNPAVRHNINGYEYQELQVPALYSGAVMVANTLVDSYGSEVEENEPYPCFCYKQIYELVFDHGILITTIDHSRDMRRIRKNIDLGYRDWNKKRDRRCIEHFIQNSLIGDYKPVKSIKKQERYLASMRAEYRENPVAQVEIKVR